MAAVTAIGDKAFVLKNGVWTDTTFDSDLMTATPLPFPSVQFTDFLLAHPETGKYFALGANVIVVIDGTAYETIAGDPNEVPSPPPAANTEPVREPVTSAPPADAGEVYTTLTVDVTAGVAPLEVNFSGELVGGPDDNRDYYCVEHVFNFGDGISQSAIPGCIEWQPGTVIERRYTANYVYEAPGEYEVTFSLGGTQSEPVTIVVVSPEEASKISAQNTSPDESPQNAPSDENTSGSSCLIGLLPLSLLLGVVSLRRK